MNLHCYPLYAFQKCTYKIKGSEKGMNLNNVIRNNELIEVMNTCLLTKDYDI